MDRFPMYYKVSVDEKVRFETVYLTDAQNFAKNLYKEENVLAQIDEIDR